MGYRRKMGRYFLILLLSLFLWGCSENSVKEKGVRRIGTLSSAAAVVLTRMGMPPAAVDEYCRSVVEARTPVVGKGTALSTERLLALKINTLVVWNYQKNALEHLSRYGIEVVGVEPLRAGNYATLVRDMEKLTGKSEEAKKIIADHEEIFRGLKNFSGKEKRVYFELYSRNRGAGDESYIGDLLRAAGGKSILKKSALAGSEYIVTQNPQVIFFVEGMGSAEEIMNRNGFSTLDAVKNKAVFPVPRALLVEGAFPLEAVTFFRKRMD